LSSVCALSLASALVHAQIHPIPPSQVPPPPAPYKTIVAGDLDRNLSLEVAVIHGNDLIVFQNPDTTSGSIVVASNALDVCYWPTGPFGPCLLYTTSTGLAIATFYDDGHVAGYDVDVIPYSLQGVLRVRYVPDDQGHEKFFFLGPDAKTFYSAIVASGTIANPPALLFALGGTLAASDFVMLDYASGVNDPGLDFGILNNVGVTIRSQTNIAYVSRSAIYPGATNAIAAVKHSITGWKDSLAWVTRLTGALPHLLLFNPNFYTSSNPAVYVKIPVSTSSNDFYGSVTAADVDGNGTEDVVMGRTISKIDVQRLAQNPAGAGGVFLGSIGHVDMSYPTGSPQTAMGNIVSGSIFNETTPNDPTDTIPDDIPIASFGAMLTDQNVLRVARNSELVFEPGTSAVNGADFDYVKYESARHQTSGCLTDEPANPPRAKWDIDLGSGWGIGPPATRLELIVRRCPPGWENPEPEALAHLIFPIDLSTTDGDGAGINCTVVRFIASALDNAGNAWMTEDVDSRYFAEVRPVKLYNYPQEFTLQRAWRWSVIGMSASCNGYEFLLDQPGAGGTVDTDLFQCNGPFDCILFLGGTSTRHSPKAVPQSSIPVSSPNVLPVIPPPSEGS